MAVIQEELTLKDSFSPQFTRFIQLGQQAAGASTMASNAAKNYQAVANTLDRRLITLNAQFSAGVTRQQEMARAGLQNTQEFRSLDNQMEKLGGTIRDLERQYAAVAPQATAASEAAKQFSQSNNSAYSSSSRLLSQLKQLAGA